MDFSRNNRAQLGGTHTDRHTDVAAVLGCIVRLRNNVRPLFFVRWVAGIDRGVCVYIIRIQNTVVVH